MNKAKPKQTSQHDAASSSYLQRYQSVMEQIKAQPAHSPPKRLMPNGLKKKVNFKQVFIRKKTQGQRSENFEGSSFPYSSLSVAFQDLKPSLTHAMKTPTPSGIELQHFDRIKLQEAPLRLDHQQDLPPADEDAIEVINYGFAEQPRKDFASIFDQEISHHVKAAFETRRSGSRSKTNSPSQTQRLGAASKDSLNQNNSRNNSNANSPKKSVSFGQRQALREEAQSGQISFRQSGKEFNYQLKQPTQNPRKGSLSPAQINQSAASPKKKNDVLPQLRTPFLIQSQLSRPVSEHFSNNRQSWPRTQFDSQAEQNITDKSFNVSQHSDGNRFKKNSHIFQGKNSGYPSEESFRGRPVDSVGRQPRIEKSAERLSQIDKKDSVSVVSYETANQSFALTDNSMISRRSISSYEASDIREALQRELHGTQIGPYQEPLRVLGTLVEEHPKVLPLYTVADRVLKDRAAYERKARDLKSSMESVTLKIKKLERVQKSQQDINRALINALVKQLATSQIVR